MTGPVVDLYAGPGGWDEGMRSLGITDVIGIETEPNACDTAEAAGHKRVQADVSTEPIGDYTGARGLVASPPCQAWSMAGKRQGEQDRAKVHALIDAYAAGSDDRGDGWADERSHHAAQPIRWVRDLRPQWVCFEQVPPVLGLWQHTAEVLRRWGYSTWCGVLNSADYGVPQTRERAVLMAHLGTPVCPPPPTHAKTPEGADLFGGELLPWVSMAQALGWSSAPEGTALRSGNQPNAAVRSIVGPAPTMAFGNNAARVEWIIHTNRGQRPDGTRQTVDLHALPSPTLTGKSGGQWTLKRPATTVAGDPRIAAPGHRDRAGGERQHEQSIRITIAEAAVLQSFPVDYPWQGTKTAQFLQVGNAVPPRLAAAIVGAVTR